MADDRPGIDPDFERIPVSNERWLHMRTAARQLRRRATPSERLLWTYLRGGNIHGFRFRRQQPIGPYVVDFFCASTRLIVEIDGGVHATQREYDAERQIELEAAGYRMLRVSDDRVMRDCLGVVREIETILLAPKMTDDSPLSP